MKNNVLITLSAVILSSVVCNASQRQTSILLKKVWVKPISGAYEAIECPTYVTDTIIFHGKADRCDGSQEPTVEKMTINGTEISLNKNPLPTLKPGDRHVPFRIIKHHTQDDTILIAYNAPDNSEDVHLCINYSTNNLLKICDNLPLIDNAPIMKISSRNNSEHSSEHSMDVIQEFDTEKGYRSFFVDKNGNKTLIHSTKKPHTLFMQDGNVHTIQEEKLSIPLLNLFAPELAVYVIRYWNICLTNGTTVLKKPILTLYNTTKVINGLLLLSIVCAIGNYALS